MRKHSVLVASVCVLAVVLVFRKAMQSDTKILAFEGEPVPYICQDGKIYVSVDEFLHFGFFADDTESRTLETRSGMVSEIVLWQENLYSKETKGSGEIPNVQNGWSYETYINGLQIGTYICEGNLLVNVEELIGEEIVQKQDAEMAEKTVFYDANGNAKVLPEKLVQITKTNRNSIHGNPESPSRFSFENCSQYLMQAEKNTAKELSIKAMQKGDILKTKNGSFPLDEVKAGECGGVSISTIQEEYTKLSDVLCELGIAYDLYHGKLELKGNGNGKTIKGESIDAIGTIPKYPYRMFVVTLKISTGETLDCLYDGETLFAANGDLEQTEIWKQHGYVYEKGDWIPLE